MFGSSCHRPHRAHEHKRKWLAAALCAASFVVGEVVWGQEAGNGAGVAPVTMGDASQGNEPQTILNNYLAAKAAGGLAGREP